MSTKLKQLGQVNRTTVGAISAYTQPADTETQVTSISIVNNASSGSTVFKIYVDDDGSTFDNTSIILSKRLLAGDSFQVDKAAIMGLSSIGQIGVEITTAGDMTFTLNGAEHS